MNINIGIKRNFLIEDTIEMPQVKKSRLSEERNILLLPPEILHEIFSYLDPAAILSMQAVSKRAYEVTNDFCVNSPHLRGLTNRLVKIRNELLQDYHTQLGIRVDLPETIYCQNGSSVNKFLTQNPYLSSNKMNSGQLKKVIEETSTIDFENETLLPELTNHRLSKEVVEATLQTLHIIKMFQQSLLTLSGQIIRRTSNYPTDKELKASKNDLLLLAKKTQIIMGILFNYDTVYTNLTFKTGPITTQNRIFSFQMACKLRFPKNLITELFSQSIQKNPYSTMHNLINAIIRHPERLYIFNFLRSEYPEISLTPCNKVSNHTINILLEHCEEKSELEALLPYVFENGALPLGENKRNILPSYKKLLMKDKPMISIQYMKHMSENAPEAFTDFDKKFTNQLMINLAALIDSDSE